MGLSSDCFLNYSLIFLDIFRHQGSRIGVEGFLEVGSSDVFHEVEETHDDHVNFVDGFPALSEEVEADISIFVAVGVKNLVEALDFWRFEGVLLGYVVPEGYF